MPIGYLITVVLFGVLVACALWAPQRRGPLSIPHYLASMTVNEVPSYVAAYLIVATYLAFADHQLGTPVGLVALALGILVLAGTVVLFRRALPTGPAFDAALSAADIEPPARGARDHLARGLLLPLRRRRGGVQHVRNVSYGELPRFHTLDLYRARSHQTGAPVFVHLHGGTFQRGRKDSESLPLLYQLAGHGWLCVSANYRVGRDFHFPDHLVDIKRLLAWVREHAEEYGGDPRCLVVGGDSAGGHLAVSAALTPNDPAYQPGFEDADTSVTAAVGLYGYYGPISDDPRSSPAGLLRSDVPPVLLVAGDHDSCVPVSWSREFAAALTEASSNTVVYAELPGAQHTFDMFGSVRCGVANDRIEAFLDHVRGSGWMGSC